MKQAILKTYSNLPHQTNPTQNTNQHTMDETPELKHIINLNLNTSSNFQLNIITKKLITNTHDSIHKQL